MYRHIVQRVAKMEAEILFFESCFSPLLDEVLSKLERSVRLIVIDQPDDTESRVTGAISIDQFVTGNSTVAPSLVERQGFRKACL